MEKGNSLNISQRVLLVVFLIQAFVQPVHSGIKYIWPLFPRIANYDIKNNEYVNLPLCSAKGPKHSVTGYESLRMPGQSSNIDILVDDTHDWDQFSIIASVYLTSDEGTVFQIQHNQDDDGDYAYIGLFYNTTNMYVRSIDIDSNVAFTVASDVPINKNEWVTVSVAGDKDEVELIVDGHRTGPVIIPLDVLLVFPGSIRIGNGFLSGLVEASGLVTCLIIYDSRTNLDDVSSSLEDDCNRLRWPSGFLDTLTNTVNSATCGYDAGQYTLVYKDYIPDSQSSNIDERVVTTKLRCASFCSKNVTCVSFTYTPLTHTCCFYSDDMSFSLKEETGTDYYVKSYLTECC